MPNLNKHYEHILSVLRITEKQLHADTGISLELRFVLKKIKPQKEQVQQQLQTLLQEFCQALDIQPKDLQTKSRAKNFPTYKQLFSLLAVDKYKPTYKELAEFMGISNHSSVLSSKEKAMTNLFTKDEKFMNLYKKVKHLHHATH